MSNKKKFDNSYYEASKKIRGDWGEINPVTKVIENKKAYKRKEKYPADFSKFFDEDDENIIDDKFYDGEE